MSVAYLGSALLLPWWATVFIAILVLSVWRSYRVVIAGGVIMDLMMASVGSAPFGFPFLYTTVFVFLAFLVWFLDRSMLG